MFGILRIPPFVNHKGNDVKSDWLADQWDERSVLGHAQFHKGRMKGNDPEIDTAQTPKRFDRRLALLGKTQKTFTDSIPNKACYDQPSKQDHYYQEDLVATLDAKVSLRI